jgi:hypothetical protein
MLVIVLAALIVSACCSSRETVRESSTLAAAYEKVDSVKEQVVVAERDTVMVTKTITITKNEAGDTTFTSVVTEKERLRDRSRHDMATYRTEVRVDTVYIERRDSVSSSMVQGAGIQSGGTALHTTLKWVFWIIIGLIGLGVVIKIRR